MRPNMPLGWRRLDVLDSLMGGPMTILDAAIDVGGSAGSVKSVVVHLLGEGLVYAMPGTPTKYATTVAGRARHASEIANGNEPGVPVGRSREIAQRRMAAPSRRRR